MQKHKNYPAQTPQNLALIKILQKFRENKHTPDIFLGPTGLIKPYLR